MLNLKIKKGVKLSKDEKPRQSWPFVKMEIGDVVEVTNKDDWRAAQKHAGNVARLKGWEMSSKWIKDKELGRIRRIS